MINNGFDHFKYSVHIRFIRNTANPYSVYKKPNPNTADPYSAYKKTNPNSFISYSVYKKRNYSVPYIFGFGRIIRIRLIPTRVGSNLENLYCTNKYYINSPTTNFVTTKIIKITMSTNCDYASIIRCWGIPIFYIKIMYCPAESSIVHSLIMEWFLKNYSLCLKLGMFLTSAQYFLACL